MTGTTSVSRAWWTDFCRVPIIFHVSHIAAAVHHDLLVGQTDWYTTSEVLIHKAKAIRMVNEELCRIKSLDQDALEQLIFAIATLCRHELESKHLEAEEILPFTPHMPLANSMKPLGRFSASPQARAVLVHLIDSQGGLRNLLTPGLAYILALYVLLSQRKFNA